MLCSYVSQLYLALLPAQICPTLPSAAEQNQPAATPSALHVSQPAYLLQHTTHHHEYILSLWETEIQQSTQHD